MKRPVKTAIYAVLVILLLPLIVCYLLIAIPIYLAFGFWFYARAFACLIGTRKSAWRRCVRKWDGAKRVFAGMVGPHLALPFEHTLAAWFRTFHRNSKSFLTVKLQDPNPVLAAYAFKCLVRFPDLTIDDIPPNVLSRQEEIETQFACIVSTISLGRYIFEYFGVPDEEETETNSEGLQTD